MTTRSLQKPTPTNVALSDIMIEAQRFGMELFVGDCADLTYKSLHVTRPIVTFIWLLCNFGPSGGEGEARRRGGRNVFNSAALCATM